MPIVFSAITPHSPILIPEIGKENQEQLESTRKSLEKLKEKLEKTEPDTIIVISPHGRINLECFNMNLNPVFKADFEEFGNFSTKKIWPGDIGLMHQIREALEATGWLQLISQEKLDYGSSVPLFMLTENLPGVKIIPFYYSGLSLEKHFEFGGIFRKELQKKTKNIAIVASGDLSHRLSKDAPGGFSPKGKKFDKRLLEILQKKDSRAILKIDQSLIKEARECGLKSFALLLGILDKINRRPKLLSYEHPFGVGYTVMDFEL